MRRRVVITGLGVIAPNGIGKNTFWQANIQGRSGIRAITRFDARALPTRIAGEVPNFDSQALGLTPLECTTMDRGTQFAIAAANLALEDAGLAHVCDENELNRMGVYMGTAMAYLEEGEKFWLQSTENGTRPLQIKRDFVPSSLFMAHASVAAIAAHHHLHGPSMVIATGCSAGADAIGEAVWAIREGRTDRMLTGGTDSTISPVGLNVFAVMGALSTRNEEPEQASRPYSSDRDGFVMAEGAGVMLLEERDLALARDAHIYAEVIAFASNNNAHHMTALPPDGAPLQHLLRRVLDDASISGEQLDYINSHGSSTPANDVAETVAYKAVFGDIAYRIPISSTKSMIGHTQGAASAIEAIVTSLVLEHQIIPPTLNLTVPDAHCDLDYVPLVARPASVRIALTHSSGFGGVNSALLLARPEWADEHM
ncbi:MAG: beta-ketoacyl-ACP synthase II [Ktedonobacteraceae bacterium]